MQNRPTVAKNNQRAVPRRCCVELLTPEERQIFKAIEMIESMGADSRLTEAVVSLMKARTWLADYIDGVEPPA